MDWPGKCDWEEPGKWCENGKVVYAPCGPDETPYVTAADCPKCHGTGERDLTADEAAEFIWRSGYIWLPDTNTDENVASGQVKRVILTVKKYDPERIHPKKEGDWRLWGFFEGDNLTAALNAAARAAYERGKE